jgi:hypothetical protein
LLKKFFCYLKGHIWEPLKDTDLQEEINQAMTAHRYNFLLAKCARCKKESRMRCEDEKDNERLQFVFFLDHRRKRREREGCLTVVENRNKGKC